MAKQKMVKPTVYRYSIVNRTTGERENIKDVICTYHHNGVLELQTIANDFLVYEESAISIEKY